MSKPKYSTFSLWSDIQPIPLHDTPGPPSDPSPGPPLATIAYSARYTEAMSYLRAVMAQNEYSERALSLTEDVIGMNPAHYTVWLYRSRILRELGDSEGEGGYLARVRGELEWLDGGVSARNLKNYQIWHHRQTLTSQLPSLPPNEIPFLTSILALDTKNYHVWTYRHWLCTHFPVLLSSGTELAAMDAMIDEDVRNNSAWNHRYFVCFGAEEIMQRKGNDVGKKGTGVVDEEVIDREVDYAVKKIRIAPQNASAWNYLKGVLRKGGRGVVEVKGLCEEFVPGGEVGGEGVRSSHAVDWLAEVYANEGEGGRAEECLDALAKKWDPVRKRYWEYRKRQIGVEVV